MTLKNKYNLFYILFCLTGCCMAGFVAIFLQYKGVSNSMIGIITGTGCISSVFLSPYISNLITKYENLTARKMIALIYSAIAVSFLLIAFLPLSPAVVVVVYTVMYALYISSVSLPQVVAGGYIQAGEDVNFGFARGLGSTSWAITALIMGAAVDFFNPVVLAIVFMCSTVSMLMLIKSMPRPKTLQEQGEKNGTAFDIIRKYKIYFMILVGFAFCLAAHSCLDIYLSNIVVSLGGTVSMYGAAVFLMALSEMPVMAMSSRLIEKVDSLTLIAVGGVAYIIRNFTVCLAPNIVVLMIGLMFGSVSYALLITVVTYYAIYNLTPADLVMGQAMIGIVTSGFGSTIGNMLGGLLQDIYGLNTMFIFTCALTATGALVIFMAKIMDKKQKNPTC